MIRLTITDGKLLQTTTIGSEKVFVGRHASNTIRLEDPQVSRKHCLIRKGPSGDYEVLDLHSRHGTRKNGEVVECSPLRVGDELVLGKATIRVEDPEGGAVPVPAPAKRSLLGRMLRLPLALRPALSPSPSGPDASRRGSFSDEIYRQIARTPWWAVSVLVHLVIIDLLFSLSFHVPPERHTISTVTSAVVQPLDPPAAAPMKRVPSGRRIRSPKVTNPEPKLVEGRPTPTDRPSKRIHFLPRTLVDHQLSNIGIGAISVLSADAQGSVSAKDFGKRGAAGANREAVGLVKRDLRLGGGLMLLRKLDPSSVVVVKGTYDHVQTILGLLDVGHVEVTPSDVDALDLKDKRVLLVNCSSVSFSRTAILKVRNFVRRGGYLLTTDWALTNVDVAAFPGYLKPAEQQGHQAMTPNLIVHIQAGAGEERDPFLRGTALAGGTAKWWLEESSFPFRVVAKDRVKVLIESPDLKRDYGAGSVAVTFRYGRGRVLHMLGHSYQQEGNLRGTFSCQRLVANFLISAVMHR